jgi:hypothetical protein
VHDLCVCVCVCVCVLCCAAHLEQVPHIFLLRVVEWTPSVGDGDKRGVRTSKARLHHRQHAGFNVTVQATSLSADLMQQTRCVCTPAECPHLGPETK